MYISDTNPKPSIDFSDEETTVNHHDMIIELIPPPQQPPPNHHPDTTTRLLPKKRAETWVQEETQTLINFRREIDTLFNTSKSNKHLWEQISNRMKEKGFDRSPTMCTDKWRNLLKEFKKVKQIVNNGGGGNGSVKMLFFKEIDDIIRVRNRVGCPVSNGGDSSKVDSFLHFSDKGIDDDSIPFGPIEASGRATLNLEIHSDHEGHPLAITAADAVTGGGVPPSFWRETPGNEDQDGNLFLQFTSPNRTPEKNEEHGDETHSYRGRVIAVKWGDYTRRVGVDGTADAIKDVIRSAFGLRTKRAFWLEDEDQVVRSLDRDMPLGTYVLHLDEGVTIKFCHYDESDHIPYPSQTISHTEERTFYTDEDFRAFMHRRGWSFLREINGYRNIYNLDDLRSDALYRGVT